MKNIWPFYVCPISKSSIDRSLYIEYISCVMRTIAYRSAHRFMVQKENIISWYMLCFLLLWKHGFQQDGQYLYYRKGSICYLCYKSHIDGFPNPKTHQRIVTHLCQWNRSPLFENNTVKPGLYLFSVQLTLKYVAVIWKVWFSDLFFFTEYQFGHSPWKHSEMNAI